MILTFSFKTFNHINQIVTSQQGTALTILALLKGTDAEIGSAWVQQHVKTFAEGFLSQVTFRDWSADRANFILNRAFGWMSSSLCHDTRGRVPGGGI